MKNYFKWIMLFLYLVAIGAVVNYYTAQYEKEKREEQMDEKMKVDSLKGEPIIIDSLLQEKLDKGIEINSKNE